MLQKQNFSISLAGGIDTKSDSKQVIPGKLLVLENGIFISPKEIKKRNGYIPLSLTVQDNISSNLFTTVLSTVMKGDFLSTFNKEIILNDSFNLYSYSEGLNNQIFKGNNTICELSTFPVIRNTNSQTLADSAINPNGIQIFAWEDSSGQSRLSIIDTATQQVIISDKVISVSSGMSVKPKCAYLGGYLVVFYLDTSTNMVLKYIRYANGIFSSPVTLFSDVDTSFNNYDILMANNKIYITYYSNTNSIKTIYLNPSFLPSATITNSGQSASNCISLFTDLNGNIWIPYASSTEVKIFIYDELLNVVVLAPTVISGTPNVYNITGIGDSTFASIFFDVLETADNKGYFSNAVVLYEKVFLNGTFTGAQLFLLSAALQSKAFIKNINNVNVPHVFLVHDSYLQPTYFLTNIYNATLGNTNPSANIVTKLAASTAGGIPTKMSSLSGINLIDNNIFQTALLQKDLLYTSASSSGTVNTYSSTGVFSGIIDFNKTNLNNLTLGSNLHISSGILGMYDGSVVVEHGFNLYPEGIVITMSGTGGSIGTGSYGYQITYEWTDNQGQLHRSSPSAVISVTNSTTTGEATLIIPTLRITAKQNVNIVIYRTQANGTVYFRLNLPNNPLINISSNNSVTYIDDASDASIGANEQLYTTGGEVPNISAPGTSILAEYQNRIILIPSDNLYSWWYSKQVIPGSPVEFSNIFVNNIGTEGGPITALLQMDSNLILFKENTIYYVSGQGPSPSGANNDFTQALSIASDVGCINSQSLILMPEGILFKSNKGIYLLNRSLAVQYIGADVEAYNSNTVTSAQLISYTNQVRFTLDSGIVLVFDYFVNQWSIFTNINAISSIISQDNLLYLQPNGLILQETPGLFLDNGNFIQLKLTTSWLSLSGIQGYQRIYKTLVLGNYNGPHQLQVQFSYDFNPIVVQQDTINVTDLINSNIYGSDYTYGLSSPYGGNYPLYQWRIFNNRQVCESIQITIQDVQSVGDFVNNQGQTIRLNPNESLSLSAIALELGMKKGLNKMPSSRSSS